MGTEIKGSEIIEDGWANKAKEGGKDLLEILNALDKELISIADSIDHLKSLGIGASAKDMANLNAALDKTNKARKLAVELERDEVKELKNLEKQRLEEIRLQQAREKSFDSYEKKLQKEAKALEKQRLEEIKLQKAREKSIDDYNKKAEKQSKILANQLLPWNQLNTKIKELTERYRNLLIAEGKETAETKKLKAEILALNRVRDTANENLGMHQNKVGQYERALGSLKNMLGQLGVAFGVFEILKSSFTILADYDEKLADIAKTTGLTIEASNEISLALLDIDTRTSITNLQELASAAGRLGIEGKDNIIGFARAADKVFVALGDDLEGTAEEIATGLGKISALAGFEKEFGIEGGIERIGSMLNELASSSKASAGAIFDFLNRTAGISSVAGIAVEDMAALGALFDSTGQSVEVAATTLNTLLPALSSDQERFAKVAGMTAEAFSQMLKDAPIEALKAVAIGAKSSKGGLDGLVESLGDFGVDSARASSIVGVLANQTDELTKLQKTSTEAVKENTSVTDEFNTKNNTLNGAVEKLKKAWQSLVIEWSNGKGVGESLKNILSFLADNLGTIVNVVLTGIKAWASYKIAMSLFRKEVDASGNSIAVGLIPNIINLGKALLGSVRGITSVRGAMTGLGTAIRSIPFAGFISFLVTVVPLVWDFAEGLFESAESNTALGKATEEANRQIADEQAKMMTLFEQLKQTNAGSERRKELIDQINSTYGTTLQNLSDETAFASQLAGAYAQVNAQLEKKIKTEVFEEELTNLIRQEIGLKQLLADFESGKRARNNALAGQAAEDLIQVEKDKKAIFDALNDLGANVEQGKALGTRTKTSSEDQNKTIESNKSATNKVIDYEKLKLDELNEFKKQKALELLEYESFLLREGSRTREQIDSLIGLEEVAIARSTVDKIIELDFKSKEVLIEHDNAYLKKVEENRIAHMSENEKIIELKAKRDEELAKEKEKQIKDELDAYLDAINKQEEARKKSDEAEQKRKEDAKEALKQELNDLTDFLQKSQELKNDAIEEDIANRQKDISDSEGEINRLQELGTANAAESIKAE